MRILTNNNQTFELDNIPDIIENDLRFCVLDYSNQNDVDFMFPPVVFLDQFSRPCADLLVGKYHVHVPLDWSIVIADKNSGSLEIIDIKHINDREFQAFCLNPIEGYMPSFLDLELSDVFSDISWNVPQLSTSNFLVVPLSVGDCPLCILLIRDHQKIGDVLDITKIL